MKRVILCGIVVIFAWWGASVLWGSQTGIAGWAAISTLILCGQGIGNVGRLGSKIREHSYMNAASMENPLYVRGYIRKPKDECIFDFFKCGFACQIMVIVLWIASLFYRLVVRSYDSQPDTGIIYAFSAEMFFYRGYQFCVMAKCISELFCIFRYKQDFRYFKGEKGVWQPFRFLWQEPNLLSDFSYEARYPLGYPETLKKIDFGCRADGYTWKQTYSMNMSGEECIVYAKKKKGNLFIFQLVHINAYAESKMEELDQIYEKFWIDSVKGKEKIKDIKLTLLLCIDEYNGAFGRKTKDRYRTAVAQHRGRYRLPAVLIFSENVPLLISQNLGFVGKKQYQEMRENLLKLLGLSEKNNIYEQERLRRKKNRR